MHEQICQVLGLDAGSWPPDHYALLGLKRGESNPQVIEQRVHERMRKLRPYQLSYPDQATEAMNRLAQAYGCLSDSASRQAYDESLLAPELADKQPIPRMPIGPIDPEPGPTDPQDPLAWLFGPWDRLADPGSAASPGNQPHFQDWAASAPPPQKRQAAVVDHNGQGPAASITPRLAEEPETRSPVWSFFWKRSGIMLVVLSLLALLAAVWRTFRP